MLSSITPLGERGRQRRWEWTVAIFFAGAITGGAISGGAAGLIGGAVFSTKPSPWWSVAVLIGAALFEISGRSVPTVRRQVDENWLNRYRSWVVGGGFGLQLGLGLATVVTSAVVYATFLIAFLTATPLSGVMIGMAFGLGRALVLLRARSAVDPPSLLILHRDFERWRPLASRLVATGSLTAAVLIGAFA